MTNTDELREQIVAILATAHPEHQFGDPLCETCHLLKQGAIKFQRIALEARIDELKNAISVTWDGDLSYYPRDDVPHELIQKLSELKSQLQELDK